MILVTGATGNVGRHVVEQLATEHRPFRPLSRTARPGFVRADLADPASLHDALKGIDSVFLVWPTLAADHAAPETLAAITEQVRRVVYLSARGVPDDPPEQPGSIVGSHTRIERLIAESGVEWTFLRPGGFATNTLMWAEQIRTSGVVRAPYGHSSRPLIHERDIAAVAVRALLDEGHTGKRYVLTGPESLTQIDQAQLIGAAVNRPVRWEDTPRDTALQQMIADGWPPTAAESALNAWADMVRHPETPTPIFEEITGAPPRTFRQWALDHAADFR